jgi:hypothetical protein
MPDFRNPLLVYALLKLTFAVGVLIAVIVVEVRR